MAKKKNLKIDKKTRGLMEAISDLIKDNGDQIKFKSKKKKRVKAYKTTCVHWMIKKGRALPTLTQSPDNPQDWKCRICGSTFPISPLEQQEYDNRCQRMLEIVEQMQFWLVSMGGDADDTAVFQMFKKYIPKFRKIQKNIVKAVKKRQIWEDSRTKTDSLSQFDSAAGYSYRSL